MAWVWYWIIVVTQAADVATTEIGVRTVPGVREMNPFMVLMAGSPPDLWRMIVAKLIGLGIIWWLVRWSKGSVLVQCYMVLFALVYAAIIVNNIGVIV